MRHARARVLSRILFLGALLGAAATSAPTAAAQTGFIEATGTVNFSSVATGPFAGLGPGTPAMLHLQIAVPGTPLAPGQYENYTLAAAASYLRVGATQMAFKAGGEPIGLQNNFPVADGVHLFVTALVQTGHFMEFELFDGTGGNVFSSPDYETEAGYYGPLLFQAIDWNLFAGGGQMGISLTQLVLHPVSSAGTWLLAGPGLAGSLPAALLTGAGSLVAGQPITLSLLDAPPAAATTLVVGLAALNAPFKGGVLVPAPTIVISGLLTNGSGDLALPATWPAGVPSAFSIYYQAWTADAGGPQGFSASNGLRSITP